MDTIQKLYYSWEDFEFDIETILLKIKLDIHIDNKKNIYIVSFYRGGLPLAVKLSNRLNDADIGILKFQTYSGKSDTEIVPIILEPKEDDLILCVDDIYDSGVTMNKAKEFLESRFNNDITYLTLFGTQEDNSYCTKLNDKKNNWVVFPWE